MRLHCANVGDSRALLCRAGRAVALSDDQKAARWARQIPHLVKLHGALGQSQPQRPTRGSYPLRAGSGSQGPHVHSTDRGFHRPDEVARIAEQGGFVANNRVMGVLAVASARLSL